MKVKLTRHVLVEDADVTPTRAGTEVDLDEAKAKEFISAGIAEEVGSDSKKKAAEPENKKAPDPAENKAAKDK